MASLGTDPRTGNIILRAYAGVNPSTGKDRTISKTLPKDATIEEVEKASAELDARAAVLKGNADFMTIEAIVLYYLDGCVLAGMSPSTLSSYNSYAKKHVIPRIGKVLFDKTDASTFSRFYRELRQPKQDGGAGLAASTVEKIHSFLSGCFSTLSGDGAILSNPHMGVKVPRAKSPEAQPLMPDDFSKLVNYLNKTLTTPVTDDESFEAYMFAVLFWVDMNTGVRRGELAGFQRRHWERRGEEWGFRVARVLVEAREKGAKAAITAKTPKSEKSKRFVTADPETVSTMETYLKVRRIVLSEHGVADNADTSLFCHANGHFLKPSEITDAFKALAKQLKLAPSAHLHTLRHTHATYLILNGYDILTIQERLGHASSRTTMDIYGHLLPGRDAEAASTFAEIVRQMGARTVETETAMYAPTCPRTGETCCRFTEGG